MTDIKNEMLAGAGQNSDTESVDTGRRQALARLGLTAAVAYAAPTLLPLTPAAADSDSSGGGSGGNDGDSHGSNSSDDGSNSNDDGPDHDDNDPTQPTEATQPSDSVD